MGRQAPIGYARNPDGDHLGGDARGASWLGPTGRPA